MTSTQTRRPTASPTTGVPLAVAPRRRTAILALPEARWAAAALVLFLAALPLWLLGAPAWAWGPLFAAVYVTGGWEPGWSGLRALADRTLDVDLLMVLAALGAAAIGQVLDGALLIVIFATSGALEAVATARTADSVRGLLDLAPQTATRLADGEERTVPTADLRVGDVILVRPGERIGADGRVTEGASEVDQATITGEPLPVPKEPGDEVFAGTLNGTGALTVRVERDPQDSVVARIVAMVEEASRTKAPTQLFIEKVEQRYSMGMVAATVALFVVPLLFGADLDETLLRAMTFMIVASPCAVVLATMPPLLSAIATAGRNGVLVKSAAVMERLAQADRVALDKTGTLTEGTPRLTVVRPVADAGTDADAGTSPDGDPGEDGVAGTGTGDRPATADELLALAAAAEQPSEHPLARAVVEAARARGLGVPAAADFSSVPGRSVTALVGGAEVTVGSPARLLDPECEAAALAGELEERGLTAVAVLRDGRPVGVLGLADRLRPDAERTVAALRALTGAEPVLLTGDNERAAAGLAARAGIADVRAGLLPQDKVAAVTAMGRDGGRVLVVGDGVNDAPALAAAHTGIAMGQAGADLTLETADAIVARDELATIPALVALSRRARRLVVQNLVIAGTFITGLVIWDLTGTLPLPLGVAGHEGSTVLVALNGLRLLRDAAWRDAMRSVPSDAGAAEPAPGAGEPAVLAGGQDRR